MERSVNTYLRRAFWPIPSLINGLQSLLETFVKVFAVVRK